MRRLKSKLLIRTICYIAFLMTAALNSSAIAQTNSQKTTVQQQKIPGGTPVVFEGDTLFFLYSKLGPYSASERAAAITQRLEAIIELSDFEPDSLRVNEADVTYDIRYKDRIVLTITQQDAAIAGVPAEALATQYLEILREQLPKGQYDLNLRNTLLRLLMLALSLIGFFLGIWLIRLAARWVLKRLYDRRKSWFNGFKFRNVELLTAERQLGAAEFLVKSIRTLALLILIYVALPVVFSVFPSTRGFAETLFGYILSPLKGIIIGVLNYLPNLITILVIVFVTRYLIRFLKFLTTEVEKGNLELPGFYADWAKPTYNMVRFVIYAFMFIVIFPYLPGSDSPVFQGVSVFLGLLLSLGSSSAISNIVAGLVITYMRPFKIGERVKIGEVSGDVLEKTLLVTRIRTIKNEEVTIPNASILSGHSVNYSTAVQNEGLILYTTVTIGYDVPWKTVHELLIGAANKSQWILKDPACFVLQTSLDDFYVSYQLNMYTKEAAKAAKIYSEVHQNIQDAFNEGGVEILSPHYRAARDGNQVTIPPNYLPPDYEAPSFRVKTNK